MFFKKDKTHLERKLDMGAFGPVPKDVTLYLLLFLDARSLAKLGMTNSDFYEMIHILPKPIRFKICNQEFEGTFAQFLDANANYTQQKQARNKEIEEIKVKRQALQEQKETLIELSAPSNSKYLSCITDEEKIATGCCCVFGIVGGILISCFLPVSCLMSTSLGVVVGDSPLAISRTAKCICGVCLACKEENLDKRENALDSNYPLQWSI
ncbi:hypothetical protein [Legionella maioricensis]|uniref:Uncharacterized protein n=1 Tax=Legionella maioricensis TaxID=2896528 RepID=A0A9X2CYB4_9GAMM|nr:hypothetical protein [Legionella maioricensis]MCL9683125.1 hypothetical protein [Legionella maioricensis]MCL9688024.1 hypothetical protein [Legionella maioricensis]